MFMVFDGFTEFKSKEEYWKDSKVQKQFSILMGLRLKCVSIKRMTTLKKEFANFQLGQYQRSQTGHELIRDDLL
jgi:predicted acetyltransferase